MKKTLICITLAVAMTASLLSGCASGSNAPDTDSSANEAADGAEAESRDDSAAAASG